MVTRSPSAVGCPAAMGWDHPRSDGSALAAIRSLAQHVTTARLLRHNRGLKTPEASTMPSFDTVSELNGHEVANAVDQANRELGQRFDFKDTGAVFELEEFTVKMKAEVDFQLKQMLEILKLRLSKRGIDLSCIEVKDAVTNLASAQQDVVLKQGLDQEVGKKLIRIIKDSKLKVQASLQGDKVRITGKSRDDLQSAIQLLRASKVEMPLQFNNFRD